MNIANHVHIERQTDLFVLRFVMRSSADGETTTEEPVAVIAVPLKTAIELGIGVFTGMMHSLAELQLYIGGLQNRINRINVVAKEVEEDFARSRSGVEQ